jgi:hypothetical protein
MEVNVVTGMTEEAPQNGSLKGASINRLACLLPHWTWAAEASRVHSAFGEALHEELVSRELDFLDTQEAVIILVHHRHCQPTNPLWRRVYAKHH